MSVPSRNYLDRVRRWIVGGVDLDKMNFGVAQRFRAQLCHEAYMFWIKDKTIRPQTLLQNIAARHYALLLKQASMGNDEAQIYVNALGIVEGCQRTASEIANDTYVLNWLVGELAVSKTAIHKAMYEDNAYWLSKFGRNTGDWRAVAKANEQLANIHGGNFDEEENAVDTMPNTNINITGDVSVVKTDRVNYTDEEKARLRKKYGMTEKELAQELEEVNGVWQAADEEDEDTPDVFDEKL